MRSPLSSRRKLFQIGLFLAFGLSLIIGSGSRADEPAEEKYKTPDGATAHDFKSGCAQIRVLHFEPPGTEKRPLVIMLHGADGWKPMKAFEFAAEGINAKGYIAILIRYYDRTKTPDKITDKERADFVRWMKGDAAKEKENVSRKHFEEWGETVRDAIAYARKLPNVDSSRVGIVGFSLGGYLALSTAPTCDPPVNAVVEMFGGIPEENRKKLGKVPPTLIVHGEEDEVVSVNEAYKAAGVILAQKQHVELEIHKGVGHVCCKPGTDTPDPLALLRARSQMTSFFKKNFEVEFAIVPRK